MNIKDYALSLKPDPKNLKSDAVAGFATGLFSIPEGMAYAQLAGVNPVYGLYSGIIATIAASLTTGTILMVSTVTSAIALSTASVLQTADIQDSQMPAALFTITFMVGVMMLALGLLRLGSLVNFVSNAVMTGFVAAASMLIIIGEMGDFSGYAPSGSNKLLEVVDWFSNISQWNWMVVAVSVSSLVLMLVLKRIPKTEKLAAIFTLLIMTVVVSLLKLDVPLVSSIATIPNSLPAPMLPAFGLIPKLALGSLSVALVALVQGAGISTAYPNPDGGRASASRDFIGEGIGNLLGSFFQSMGTGGSLSRTGISVGAGTQSRWGGIFAGLWLGLILLLFGSLAELVPLSVIAGMLFVIGGELIAARLPNARLVYTSSWGSAAAGLLTFVSALFIPLQYTIFLGAGLSLLLYIGVSASKIRLFQLVRGEDGYWQEQDLPQTFPSNQATVVAYEGANFFAEVPAIIGKMPSLEGVSRAVIIWRLRGAEEIHSTFLKQLSLFAQKAQAGGNCFMLEGVEPHVMTTLEKTGILDALGRDNVFPVQPGMGQALDSAWQEGQTWLAAKSGQTKEE
ncbi:MAG: SulP family inorganic anion transporter [Anaerolineales bacterium]|nr:SulP family inorganic anion transporter [Anaerolineales bacterium]